MPRNEAVQDGAEAWAPLLAARRSVADLRAAWGRQATFAEDRVAAAAGCVGLSVERACSGFAEVEHGDPGFSYMRIGFSARATGGSAERGGVPPRLQPLLPPGAHPVGVGDPGTIYLQTLSMGSSGKGLVALVSGPLVDDGLIEPGPARASLMGDPAGARALWSTRTETVQAETGRHWMLGFEDAEIPDGSPLDVPPDLPPARRAQAVRRWMRARLDIFLDYRAVRAGRASLVFAVRPLESSEFVRAEGEIEITGGGADRDWRSGG